MRLSREPDLVCNRYGGMLRPWADHTITVGLCSVCGDGVCGLCQRPLYIVRPRSGVGFVRHSSRVGCRVG